VVGLSELLAPKYFPLLSVKCQNKSNADKNFIACQKCGKK